MGERERKLSYAVVVGKDCNLNWMVPPEQFKDFLDVNSAAAQYRDTEVDLISTESHEGGGILFSIPRRLESRPHSPMCVRGIINFALSLLR